MILYYNTFFAFSRKRTALQTKNCRQENLPAENIMFILFFLCNY